MNRTQSICSTKQCNITKQWLSYIYWNLNKLKSNELINNNLYSVHMLSETTFPSTGTNSVSLHKI